MDTNTMRPTIDQVCTGRFFDGRDAALLATAKAVAAYAIESRGSVALAAQAVGIGTSDAFDVEDIATEIIDRIEAAASKWQGSRRCGVAE